MALDSTARPYFGVRVRALNWGPHAWAICCIIRTTILRSCIHFHWTCIRFPLENCYVMTIEKQGYPCPGSSRQKRNCQAWETLFHRLQLFISVLWPSIPLSRVPCVTSSHPFSGGKQLPAQNMASLYFKPSKHIQRTSFVQKADKTVYITYITPHLEESIKKNIHMLKSKNRKLIFNLALILF